jgi:hypothetical protein
MRTLTTTAALVATMLVSLPARGETPPAQSLTIDEAIAVAGAKNPELALAAMTLDAQKKRIKSTKGLRLPSLILKSNLLVWNEELTFALPSAYGFEEWAPTYPTEPPMVTEWPVEWSANGPAVA